MIMLSLRTKFDDFVNEKLVKPAIGRNVQFYLNHPRRLIEETFESRLIWLGRLFEFSDYHHTTNEKNLAPEVRCSAGKWIKDSSVFYVCGGPNSVFYVRGGPNYPTLLISTNHPDAQKDSYLEPYMCTKLRDSNFGAVHELEVFRLYNEGLL